MPPTWFCSVNVRGRRWTQTPRLEGVPFRANPENTLLVFGDSIGSKRLPYKEGPVHKGGIK